MISNEIPLTIILSLSGIWSGTPELPSMVPAWLLKEQGMMLESIIIHREVSYGACGCSEGEAVLGSSHLWCPMDSQEADRQQGWPTTGDSSPYPGLFTVTTLGLPGLSPK